MGQTLCCIIGSLYGRKNLDIPSIGGKDSMSGTFEDIDVPPTLISFAVTYDKVENIISPEFKGVGNRVVLIPLDIDDVGMVDFEELSKNYTRIKELIDNKKVLSASSIKSGGMARSISEMAFGNKIGFKFDSSIDIDQLFLPLYGSIILEIDGEPEEVLKGLDYKLLGSTIKEEYIEILGEKIDLDLLIEEWTKPLKEVFPIAEASLEPPKEIKYTKGSIKKSSMNIARPRVFIPIFTGSHGEYDMGRAFERAGAIVDYMVFRTLKDKDIEASYREMAERINKSQIVGIPDGAVLGDEPDGGGKLIANILKNPYIEEAIMELLNKDGLILGIGSGFQGLIKSGLLPYGEIRELDENSLNITYNKNGYHISTIVKTKLVSNLSPWFANAKVGDVYHLPLSRKEGRIVGNKETVERLIEKGQIASQYVDRNLTGSIYGIEAITNPDGRILGRSTNPDRLGQGIYRNVEMGKDEGLFEAGVNYFR